MATVCGYCLWLLFVATVCGYCLWLLFVATVCGYCLWLLWLLFVATVCGYCLLRRAASHLPQVSSLPRVHRHRGDEHACTTTMRRVLPEDSGSPEGSGWRVGSPKEGSPAPGRRTRVHDDDATCFAGGLGFTGGLGLEGGFAEGGFTGTGATNTRARRRCDVFCRRTRVHRHRGDEHACTTTMRRVSPEDSGSPEGISPPENLVLSRRHDFPKSSARTLGVCKRR